MLDLFTDIIGGRLSWPTSAYYSVATDTLVSADQCIPDFTIKCNAKKSTSIKAFVGMNTTPMIL